MALRFRPVDTAFYDLFSEQAQHLVVGAALLAEMLSETAVHDDVAARMRQAEHEADETTHALFKRVNSTFVTPFDREDIYRLGSGLDDVMDMMDEAVDLILLYEVKVLPPELSQQVEVLVRLPEAPLVAEVGEMLELSFAPETFAWELHSNGDWAPNAGTASYQERLIERHRRRRTGG